MARKPRLKPFAVLVHFRNRYPAVLHLPMQVIIHMRFNPVFTPCPALRFMHLRHNNPCVQNLRIPKFPLRRTSLPIPSKRQQPTEDPENNNNRSFRQPAPLGRRLFGMDMCLAHSNAFKLNILSIFANDI